MEIIALSGFARAGKDETAKVLVEQFGFVQVAFADKLREMLYALNPYTLGEYEVKPEEMGMEPVGDKTFKVIDHRLVKDVIDEFGWDGYKESPWGTDMRRLLQRLGTEAGRQTLWDSIWIDAALTGLAPDAKVVVSDARFYNEFDAVRSRGGEIWRIERPGVGPANDHASEMEAIDYPHFARTLHNSRDLDYFRGLVMGAYNDFVTDRRIDEIKARRPGPNAPVGGQYKVESVVKSTNMPKKR